MIRAIPTLVSMAIVVSACTGTEKTARAPERLSTTAVTSAPAPSAPSSNTRSVSPGIAVSDEIAQKCRLAFANAEQTPKSDFNSDGLNSDDFNSDELGPADRDALEQIGKCLTTGPLAGHAVELFGRADPRGTEQYGVALGDRRTDAVARCLKALGVGVSMGRGEVRPAKDRRVDVLLAD